MQVGGQKNGLHFFKGYKLSGVHTADPKKEGQHLFRYHSKSNKEDFVSLILSRDISTDGYPLNVSNYVSSDSDEEHENIDFIAVRKALLKQQTITDDYLSKLNCISSDLI